jgi:hypothetical protein
MEGQHEVEVVGDHPLPVSPQRASMEMIVKWVKLDTPAKFDLFKKKMVLWTTWLWILWS